MGESLSNQRRSLTIHANAPFLHQNGSFPRVGPSKTSRLSRTDGAADEQTVASAPGPRKGRIWDLVKGGRNHAMEPNFRCEHKTTCLNKKFCRGK